MSENAFREVLLYGAAAVKTCFTVRPQAIRRAWVDEERQKEHAELLKWLAAEKRPYSIGSDADLRRIIGHSRHDGVVVMTERPPIGAPKLGEIAEWRDAAETIVYVTKLSDSRQMAVIARVAAAMAVKRIFLDEPSAEAAFSSTAWSECDGAMEHLRLYRQSGPVGFLKLISDKYTIIGVVREGGRNPDYATPIRIPGRATMLLVGGGENGIDGELISKCSHTLHMPNRGAAPIPLNTADAVAHFLPWLTSKNKKPGEGFRTKMNAAKAAKAAARAASQPKTPKSPSSVEEGASDE